MSLYERCHELFVIENNQLIRKTTTAPNAKVGDQAGWLDGGYYRVRIDGKPFLVHRVLFLMRNGFLPEIVDHIDGNTLNNSSENLRPATYQENRWNSKPNTKSESGIKGVYNDRGRWKALINVSGVRYYLGMYSSPEEAGRVVKEKYAELQKEFALK